MLFPEGQITAWLCTEPTRMNKSFDGLVALTKHHLNQNPLSGDLFVFMNRRRNYVKVLYFDRDGYCIWSKRLVRGTFGRNAKMSLTWTELKLLLEGLDEKKMVRRKRYHHKT